MLIFFFVECSLIKLVVTPFKYLLNILYVWILLMTSEEYMVFINIPFNFIKVIKNKYLY